MGDTLTPAQRALWNDLPDDFKHGRRVMGPTALSTYAYMTPEGVGKQLRKLCAKGLVKRIALGTRRGVYVGVRE